MKTSSSYRRHPTGFISFLLVLATGAVLTALMLAAYRRSLGAQMTESKIQLRMDYSEKEETILRSIVASTPNRAIRAMMNGSAAPGVRGPLSWQSIFNEALALANSRTSISPEMINSLNIPNLRVANTGDGLLDNPNLIFAAIPTNPIEPGLISAGINRCLIGQYPPPLTSLDALTNENDSGFPIISNFKQYGPLAQGDLNSAALNGNAAGAYGLPVGDYPKFNRLRYPNINFGYARPGEAFVAKRNWWAFSLNVSSHDGLVTGLARPRRNFVLSIYEIPSQLAISAASFMSLGQYASGVAWTAPSVVGDVNNIGRTNINGGMFVGRAALTGNRALESLALRRGMEMDAGSSVGGVFEPSPFAAGVRETFQHRQETAPGAAARSLAFQTTLGASFPVSLASESGRAAFIPISRDSDFFDRFHPTRNDPVSIDGARDHVGRDALSSTGWNNYSVGAQQCAMRLDVIAENAGANPVPTALRFQYFMPNGDREVYQLSQTGGVVAELPVGYVQVAEEGESYQLPEGVTADVAYGSPGEYTFNLGGLSGNFRFIDGNFAELTPGQKFGYVRMTPTGVLARQPFLSGVPVNGQSCIEVYPERIPAYLESIGGAGPDINNSLVVNVDYSPTGLNIPARRPSIPCLPTDYGVVLKECGNLTRFTRGFSLVTNLRLFVGDHFNQVPMVDPLRGAILPPCSIFAPEKRFGTVAGGTPITVRLGGQIGSLARVDRVNRDDVDVPIIHPLDSRTVSGALVAPGDNTVNLNQITHPGDLPPITMMNWLVLLEEVRP